MLSELGYDIAAARRSPSMARALARASATPCSDGVSVRVWTTVTCPQAVSKSLAPFGARQRSAERCQRAKCAAATNALIRFYMCVQMPDQGNVRAHWHSKELFDEDAIVFHDGKSVLIVELASQRQGREARTELGDSEIDGSPRAPALRQDGPASVLALLLLKCPLVSWNHRHVMAHEGSDEDDQLPGIIRLRG